MGDWIQESRRSQQRTIDISVTKVESLGIEIFFEMYSFVTFSLYSLSPINVFSLA